jgi:hypothetical protein
MRRANRNIAVGSKSEVRPSNRQVCFAPVNGHRQAALACPKSASKRLMHRSKIECLFDHLVGAEQE